MSIKNASVQYKWSDIIFTSGKVLHDSLLTVVVTSSWWRIILFSHLYLRTRKYSCIINNSSDVQAYANTYQSNMKTHLPGEIILLVGKIGNLTVITFILINLGQFYYLSIHLVIKERNWDN